MEGAGWLQVEEELVTFASNGFRRGRSTLVVGECLKCPREPVRVLEVTGWFMRDDRQPTVPSSPIADRRRLEQAAIGWIGLNVVLVIIWAMSGGGPFWPGWIMLLSAVVLVLRLWRRSTMGGGNDARRVRSRGR